MHTNTHMQMYKHTYTHKSTHTQLLGQTEICDFEDCCVVVEQGQARI